MQDIDKLLNSLNNTKFRGSFHLNSKMKEYVKIKGIEKVRDDAYSFVEQRLKSANPKNDGKQTPMRQVHPVFIAQHATGTCCRSCLERIHKIKKGIELSNDQVDYVVKVIMTWINKELEK